MTATTINGTTITLANPSNAAVPLLSRTNTGTWTATLAERGDGNLGQLHGHGKAGRVVSRIRRSTGRRHAWTFTVDAATTDGRQHDACGGSNQRGARDSVTATFSRR
jgi:hypothetical protein